MSVNPIDLSHYGLHPTEIIHNATPARLYEFAITGGHAVIAASGALATRSGDKTGRSPKDKRIVDHPDSSGDIWWGDINIRLTERSFAINRQRAIDYLNTRDQIFVFDGFAGWDPKHRLKVRVIAESAYHALFMHNMLIRPTDQQLAEFGEPDVVILNAGSFPANPYTAQMTSTTSIDLSIEQGEFVILGTQYAGEMKKGVFTVMNYLMPKRGVLSMHCSANQTDAGDLTLFFGLSGTGKTTLSTDPARQLIGDDEHCWTDDGVFNIEGGCYAKVIHLSQESEPEIFNAIRYGSVLENVVFDETTHEVNYDDASITENTRVAYPIDFIENAKIPCVGPHPKNIIFLTCDAFGVLPPVSKLSTEQAMYHFISGYTAKTAGTEMNIDEPVATFSACFGAAFLVWHPAKYAELLAEQIRKHGANTWLVNTGWAGGPYGVGKRMSLKHTRSIIDAIHSGELADGETRTDPMFGLEVPVSCSGVPSEILWPKDLWADGESYDGSARRLADLFRNNFKQFESGASDAICGAGPTA
ncbi:Phosphoenolpyruvate carboxykinase [ATP] [Rubripirellula lacrimiformis]|uniref:Phosphoenolpyruvate carboxykinase (ATP) n=1 Tax=Rubripirellula lacrimiformis TaxID=1930273 RepID=A0A517NFV5_9BACT|nr:phosphoenolpyruvate carboxykinase (ATP) [Rubripirellula lacrimiformis]QDT06005.1 Phosphoenolpyruvate carboxykinase [ATP] [Rubripirellula lacrimiformis]